MLDASKAPATHVTKKFFNPYNQLPIMVMFLTSSCKQVVIYKLDMCFLKVLLLLKPVGDLKGVPKRETARLRAIVEA